MLVLANNERQRIVDTWDLIALELDEIADDLPESVLPIMDDMDNAISALGDPEDCAEHLIVFRLESDNQNRAIEQQPIVAALDSDDGNLADKIAMALSSHFAGKTVRWERAWLPRGHHVSALAGDSHD